MYIQNKNKSCIVKFQPIKVNSSQLKLEGECIVRNRDASRTPKKEPSN